MMYVAHNAFTRDLRRLTAAAGASQTAAPVMRTGWAMLKKQLHIHHTAEDKSLWPLLRGQVTGPGHVAAIDAMEAEHARIDPQLEAVDQALAVVEANRPRRGDADAHCASHASRASGRCQACRSCTATASADRY